MRRLIEKFTKPGALKHSIRRRKTWFKKHHQGKDKNHHEDGTTNYKDYKDNKYDLIPDTQESAEIEDVVEETDNQS
jgi:hypothetical protein